MLEDKDFAIRIDTATWPGGVPQEIASLGPTQTLGLGEILAATAILTRPPTVQGFHLSDQWAFFRYGPAFSPGRAFKLRPEWEDLDPHQKTILSDEVGVGVTCSLLIKALDLQEVVPTLHFLRAIEPDRFSLGTTNRIGPQKSPDYVGWRNSSSRIVVIECKGTQNPGSLAGAMSRGRAQKSNLTDQSGGVIEHPLVAGLYIPRHDHGRQSQVRIADPEPVDYLPEILDKIERPLVRAGIRQVWLAKMLALLGLDRLANLLAATPTTGLNEIADEFLSSWAPLAEEGLIHEILPRTPADPDAGSQTYVPRRLEIAASPEVIASITEAPNLLEFLMATDNEEHNDWAVKRSEGTTLVMLPMGFTVALEMEIPEHEDLDRLR